MANYSIALGTRNPQIDVGPALQLAQNNRRLTLAEQQAAMQNKLGDARLSQLELQNKLAGDKRTALSRYAQTKNIDDLMPYPQVANQMLDMRSKMTALDQAKQAQSRQHNARAALRIRALPPGPARQGAWQAELDAGLKEGRIPQQTHEQLYNVDPSDEILNSVVQQAMDVDKLYDAQKPTAMQKNADFYARLPENDPRRKFMEKPSTVINTGQDKYSDTMGKGIAEREMNLWESTDAATDYANTTRQLRTLLTADGVYSGTAGDTISELKKMGATLFGEDSIAGVPESEMAKKIGRMAIADIKKKMDDPRMSDSDRKLYESIPPSIGDSADGIVLADEMAQQSAEFARKAEEQLEYLKSTTPDDVTAYREFRKWKRKTNRWSPELVRTMATVAKQTGKQQSPTAGLSAIREKYGIDLGEK